MCNERHVVLLRVSDEFQSHIKTQLNQSINQSIDMCVHAVVPDPGNLTTWPENVLRDQDIRLNSGIYGNSTRTHANYTSLHMDRYPNDVCC